MLARRFSCPPVHEAPYEPRAIPDAAKDMEGTVLLRPKREEWLELLGEMVQMTNEAVRRRAKCARDASKPLSLEYMADRMDVRARACTCRAHAMPCQSSLFSPPRALVLRCLSCRGVSAIRVFLPQVDDPLFGYLAVARETGWMQGYVTCTTFTTWHRGFRWESTNPVLDLNTAPHLVRAASTPSGKEKGADDVDVKPIAGPKVDADGSLARDLQREIYAGDPEADGIQWPRIAELSLLGALGCGRWLVQLIIDGLEAPDSPYRYVICQATDGSIPFYERMGFVRVGCVTRSKRANAEAANADEAAAGDGGGAGGKRKRSNAGKAAEASAAAAAAAAAAAVAAESGDVVSRRMQHVCEAGETCASVAAQYGVDAFDVLFLNQRKFGPKLHKDAALKKGTALLVPNPLSVSEVASEEDAARQTWHELSDESNLRAVAAQLNVPAKELLELNRSSIKGLQLNSILMRGTRLQTGGIDADVDEYCHWTFPDDDQASGCPSYMMARRLKPHSERVAMCPPEETTDASSVLERSRRLLVRERPSIQPSESRRDIYDRYVAARAAKLSGDDAAATASAPPPLAAPPKLFNRVVAIKGEESYTYWYVLTYLPDLQWCHVAPLEQRGLFESNKGPSAGRAKWMLVNEEQGGEIDVGAGRCVVMEAREMKKTKENADEEEWDVIGPAAV